jgi:hypothetical protein
MVLPLAIGALAMMTSSGAVSPGGAAGHLEVGPAVVEIAATRQYEDVTVRNGSDMPRELRTAAYAWTQGTDGTMYLVPTADVSAFPATLLLRPSEARRVRFSVVRRCAGQERAYRLVLEFSAERGADRLRVLVPVFVAASGGEGASPADERRALVLGGRPAPVAPFGGAR